MTEFKISSKENESNRDILISLVKFVLKAGAIPKLIKQLHFILLSLNCLAILLPGNIALINYLSPCKIEKKNDSLLLLKSKKFLYLLNCLYQTHRLFNYLLTNFFFWRLACNATFINCYSLGNRFLFFEKYFT